MSESKTETHSSIINKLIDYGFFFDFNNIKSVSIRKSRGPGYDVFLLRANETTIDLRMLPKHDAYALAKLCTLLINKGYVTEQTENIKTLITRMNEMVEQINEIKEAIMYAPRGRAYVEAKAGFEATLELTEVEN